MQDWEVLSAQARAWLSELPILLRFLMGLALFTIVPSISRRARLPGVVGLILAGILLGKSGLNLWPEYSPVLDMFAEVGKLLVLFYAGMEVDLDQFLATKSRSIVFGLATLLLPLGAGVAVGLHFGYGVNAALLIGSLIASHTLLGFPILQRLGLGRRESVMVTTGATIFTDVVALLILAVCVSIHTTGFDPTTLGIQVLEVVVYAVVVIVVVSKLANRLFANSQGGHDAQLLQLLLIVTISSLLAEVIHLEPIVGAFLSGLAVSRALHGTEVKAHIESLGNTLFLPAFFVAIGLGIDARAAARSVVSDWQLVLALLTALVGGKFLAAWLAGAFGRYTRVERLTMWSLSLPQVAATIAATLVAYRTTNAQGERLIDEPVVNAVFVLVLLTATIGPVLTGRYAARMVEAPVPGPAADRAA